MLSFGTASGARVLAMSVAGTEASPIATTGEQTVATINIPAGQLVGNMINGYVHCLHANTLATTRTWRVKLGGTTIAQWTNTGSVAGVGIEFFLADRGDNTQVAGWAGVTSGSISATTYTAAIDTSVATTLTITVDITSVAGSETAAVRFYNFVLLS